MNLPWFRLYNEFSGDPNIQSLAFEDQRHFIVLMCLKSSGVLDREYPSPERRATVIARGLGLDPMAAAEVQRRLTEAGLLLDDWQPKGWDDRQYQSDSSAERARAYRDRQRTKRTVTSPSRDGDGDGTAQDTEQSRADTEQSRAEEKKTGRPRAPSPHLTLHAAGSLPLAGPAGSSVALPLADGRTEATISDAHLAEMAALYPGVDVVGELRRMRGWLIAHPPERKTPGGLLAFVHRWLGKEQNGGRGRGGGSPGGEVKFQSKADKDYLEQFNRKMGGQP